MASSFLYSNNCYRSVFAKNWRLFTQLSPSACFHVALSSIVPTHFPNQMSKGHQLNSQKLMPKKYNYDVKTAFCTPLFSLLVSCLVTEWPPVACKLYPSGRQSHANDTRVAASRMQISADFSHVACDWRPRGYNFAFKWLPLGYNLHATGRQSHSNFACTSDQLRAKPPAFCKHAARTIIWIKKWRRHEKIWESTRHMY